jgi:glycosyltransferase involved in cell wall biosynthesis
VVLSHPTQYYSPWFRWIRAHTDVEFRVFYLWDFGVAPRRDPQFQKTFAWDVDLLSGYESEFVPNAARDPGTHHFFGLRNPELPGRLAKWRPGAVLLFGYKWQSHLRAAAWSLRRGVPIVFRGDSHFLGRPSPGWRRVLPLRLLYGRFAAIAYVGAANRAYFERLGLPARKLFFAPHAVDAGLFDPNRPEHQSAAAAIRARLGFATDARVALFAGKFTAAKQPVELLRSFIALRKPGCALVFAGDGPERGAVEAQARLAPPGTVRLLPFGNQTEMPARYLMADLFVLPSFGLYETWGLAVNEAMSMGRPCLVSDRVGCQLDLVENGQTGWVARAVAGDLERVLGEALDGLASPSERERLRRNVLTRISGYSYARATEGLLSALATLGPCV